MGQLLLALGFFDMQLLGVHQVIKCYVYGVLPLATISFFIYYMKIAIVKLFRKPLIDCVCHLENNKIKQVVNVRRVILQEQN